MVETASAHAVQCAVQAAGAAAGAVKEGVPAVAQDLGLQPAQLYAWRAKSRHQRQDAQARAALGEGVRRV